MTLDVQGNEATQVQALRERLRPAVTRGTREDIDTRMNLVMILAMMVIPAIIAAAVVSALYLLNQSGGLVSVVGMISAVAGLVVGALWGTWLYPALEVARHRQTNLWRFVKSFGPVLISIILAGITKSLYG